MTRRSACEVCAAGKRACDRKLPHCGRCERLSLRCQYRQNDGLSVRTAPGCSGTTESMPCLASLDVRHQKTKIRFRQQFNAEKKAKVHLLRSIGACLWCKLKKKEVFWSIFRLGCFTNQLQCDVSMTGQCQNCLTKGQSFLAEARLCIRQRLTVMRYDELGTQNMLIIRLKLINSHI